MRNYLINDIYESDLARLCAHLKDLGSADALDGLYWLDLPDELLSAEQLEHFSECGPYSLALECQDDWANLELLVRSRRKLRCSCVAYANEDQRVFMMNRLDIIFSELGIKA